MNRGALRGVDDSRNGFNLGAYGHVGSGFGRLTGSTARFGCVPSNQSLGLGSPAQMLHTGNALDQHTNPYFPGDVGAMVTAGNGITRVQRGSNNYSSLFHTGGQYVMDGGGAMGSFESNIWVKNPTGVAADIGLCGFFVAGNVFEADDAAVTSGGWVDYISTTGFLYGGAAGSLNMTTRSNYQADMGKYGGALTTVGTERGLHITAPAGVAGATVTTRVGVDIPALTGGVNNYGVRSLTSSQLTGLQVLDAFDFRLTGDTGARMQLGNVLGANLINFSDGAGNFTAILAEGPLSGVNTLKLTLADLSVPALRVDGLTGSTAPSRLVGATTGGAPGSGAHLVGDWVMDNASANFGLASIWVCITAGTPGTWVAIPCKTTNDAIYQPINAALTTIGGLTATTDNFIVSVASAWASRTPAQVRTTLGLVIGTNVQAWDADLDTFAALSASNDDFVQRKAGAWSNRTLGQVRSDLYAAMNVADDVFTIQDNGDPTKQVRFQLSGLTTATARILTVPDADDTIVGKATTDTFTNKTFDTAGTGNSLSINGVAATANTGTGAVVRAASPTLSGTALAAALTLSGALDSSGGTATVRDGTAGDGKVVLTSTNSPASIAGVAVYKDTADTQPVASLLSVTGAPALSLGPGGSTGVDVGITRTGAAAATVAGLITFTNGIKRRVSTTASSATPTPNADTDDGYTVTALAAGATFGSPGGSPHDGQRLVIRVKDNGTARTLAFNAIYRASSDLALPTTTVISKTLYMGFMFNSADTKWDMVALIGNF